MRRVLMADIKIGQNGKLLDENVESTKEQQRIVNDNLREIRRSFDAQMKADRINGC
jgi:hypothetical protein